MKTNQEKEQTDEDESNKGDEREQLQLDQETLDIVRSLTSHNWFKEKSVKAKMF